jgi:type I restriction enzyme S subunit
VSGFVICGKPQFSGEKVRLGDIGVFKTGGTPSKKHPEYYGGTVPWVSTPALNGSSIGLEDATQMITQEGVDHSATKVIPEGSLMVGIRVGVGKVAVNAVPMCTNQDIVSIVGVDSDIWNIQYLSYAIQSNSSLLQSHKRGATITGITTKELKQLAIPFLPMEQQLSLVNLLNCIKRSGAKAERQLSHLDTLVKSRFIEMFGGLGSDGLRSLKDVCSIITDGTHQPPKFVDEGIPFLFVSNIASDAVDYETNKFISVEDYEQLIRRTPIEIGDVLVSAVGSFGHPAVVRNGRPFCFQRHIAYLKPRHDLVDSNYLHAVLLSDEAQRYMDRCAKGVAQRTVTLKSFREMKIPVPPMSLQEEFAAFVQYVDKLRFILLENPSPMFGHRSFCCSTNSGNGGVILEAKDY